LKGPREIDLGMVSTGILEGTHKPRKVTMKERQRHHLTSEQEGQFAKHEALGKISLEDKCAPIKPAGANELIDCCLKYC
jgi:hypothetical protein